MNFNRQIREYELLRVCIVQPNVTTKVHNTVRDKLGATTSTSKTESARWAVFEEIGNLIYEL